MPTLNAINSPDGLTKIEAMYHLRNLKERVLQRENIEGLTPEAIQCLIEHAFSSDLIIALHSQKYISSAERILIFRAHFDQVESYNIGSAVWDDLPIEFSTAEKIHHVDPRIACRAMRLLRLLAEREVPDAIALVKELLKYWQEPNYSKDVNKFLKDEWNTLLAALMKQNVMCDEAIRYSFTHDPRSNEFNDAFRNAKPAILKTLLTILESPQSPENHFPLRGHWAMMDWLQLLIFYDQVGIREILHALPRIAASPGFVRGYAAGILEGLLRRLPEPETYKQVTAVAVKVVDESYHTVFNVLLTLLLNKGYGVQEFERIAAAKLMNRSTAYAGRQMFQCLFETGHGLKTAKRLVMELSEDPKRQSDANKLFQLLPIHEKVQNVIW
jgi:hypothetical protein